MKNDAKLLTENGQIEEALALFQQAEDVPNLIRLLQKHASTFLVQGRHQALEHWLRKLPVEELVTNPWLLFWLGSTRMPFDPDAAKPLFEQALDLFDESGDAAGVFLAWSGIVDAISYSFDSFLPHDEWMQRFNLLSSRYQTFINPEIESRVITSLLWIMTFQQPLHSDFAEWEKRGLAAAEAVTNFDIKINIHLPSIMAAIFAGDLIKSEMLIGRLKEAIPSPGYCSLALISLECFEAFYCWMAGRFRECEVAVARALELSDLSGTKPLRFQILSHGAAGMLSTLDIEGAKSHLGKITSFLDRLGRWEKGFYYILKTWQALLSKNYRLSLFHADKSLQMLLAAGMPQAIAYAHLGMGCGLHEIGEYQSAAVHFNKAREYCNQTRSYQTEFACWLAEANLAYECGDIKLGEQALVSALSLGRKHGYFNCCFWRPAVMAMLCCKALEAGIEEEYVRELIRQRQLTPEALPIEIENWPWPVRIYTLGRFELVKEQKPVRFSGKAKQKPLDLLKALIALGGRKVSEFRLADAMWPDSDGDMQHQSLATTLHRLRRIVGLREFVHYSNGHLSLDPRYCWVDAWAFERLLSHAETEAREMKKESILSAVRSAEKAVSLYKGDFLPLTNREHWCINKKEHLKNRFLRGVVFLGRNLEKIGEHEKAVLHYQRAIDIEPLAEEFYQRLMIYYYGKGQYADAALLYRRCRKNLATFLNVEPSKQTNSLYRSLLSGSDNMTHQD